MPAPRKLTPTDATHLPAIGRRTEYRDELVTGLMLRVSATGARTWAVAYTTPQGQERRYRIGIVKDMSLAEAREEARQVRARVTNGHDPQAERNATRRLDRGISVRGLVDNYIQGSRFKPATAREWKRLAKVEVKKLGDVPAAELTRAQVRAWGAAIAEHAPYVANRAHDLLRAAFGWGVGEELLTGSPFVNLKRPAAEARRARTLSVPELRAVLLALDDVGGRYADATRLMLLTLARRSAVLGMRREELEQLDGTAPRWVIPGDRTGLKGRASAREARAAHVVPLSPPALEVVRVRLAELDPQEPHLFPPARARRRGETRKSTVAWWSSRFVASLRKKADERFEQPLQRWTVHDLRRTGATLLREELGVSRGTVRRLLGHGGQRDATAIYDRSELMRRRRRVLRRWAAFLQRVRDGQVGVPKGTVLAFAGSGPGLAESAAVASGHRKSVPHPKKP